MKKNKSMKNKIVALGAVGLITTAGMSSAFAVQDNKFENYDNKIDNQNASTSSENYEKIDKSGLNNFCNTEQEISYSNHKNNDLDAQTNLSNNKL